MSEVIPFAEKIEFRKRVDAFQSVLEQMPQAETALKHLFAHGLYGRQLFVPKGTTYIGKIHRFSHFRFVLAGHLLIVTDEGRYECKAPHVMVTPVGARRVGHALEDTLIMTVHATDKTDVEEIEREIIMPREEQLTQEERLFVEHFTP